jgi:hypothetical protein
VIGFVRALGNEGFGAVTPCETGISMVPPDWLRSRWNLGPRLGGAKSPSSRAAKSCWARRSPRLPFGSGAFPESRATSAFGRLAADRFPRGRGPGPGWVLERLALFARFLGMDRRRRARSGSVEFGSVRADFQSIDRSTARSGPRPVTDAALSRSAGAPKRKAGPPSLIYDALTEIESETGPNDVPEAPARRTALRPLSPQGTTEN